MKIIAKKDKIIFEFDRFEKRFNPWMIDKNGKPEDVGEHPKFTGLIVKHRKDGNHYDEIGFAQTLDRDYKGKSDDVGDFIVKWHNGKESFIKECTRLGLVVVEINL